MDEKPAREQIDPVLLPFLAATEETESGRFLDRLVCEDAQPVIREIVRFNLQVHASRAGRSQEEQDAEDVASEVLVKLVKQLREFKANPRDRAIHNLRSYVAMMAYNACDDYLRRKYPRRHSLKNKLRYVLTHQEGLALWEADDRRQWCGLARWARQEKSFAASRRMQQLRDSPQAFPAGSLARGDAQSVSSPDLLRAIFDWVGGPCRLDDLVNLVADLWGIQDQAPQGDTDPAGLPAGGPFADPRRDTEVVLDQRRHLKRCGLRFASCR